MGSKINRVLIGAAFLFAVGIGWFAIPAPQAAAAPFTSCSTTSRYFVALVEGSGTPQTTTLQEQIMDSSGDPQYTPLGTYSSGGTYNAIGFNENDNFIYGILGSGGINTLVRIDDTGAIVANLGTIPGLPSQFFQQGAMDGNFLYVRSSAADTSIYRIDVTTNALSTITLTSAINVGDFTFLGGYLWGVNTTSGGDVVRVDISTGQVDFFPQTVVPDPANPYAAAWTYGDGSIGVIERVTGNFFRFMVNNPAAVTPTFSLVTSGMIPEGTGIDNADGTSCISPPTDVGVTASAPANVLVNSSFNVTYTVTNHGPSGSSGQLITQTLPPEMINPSTSTPGCTITNISGQNVLRCVHGPISVGGSFNIVVTATAPASAACFTNTADLIPQEQDTNAANNRASAPTCAVLSLPSAPNIGGDGSNALANTGTNIFLTLAASFAVVIAASALFVVQRIAATQRH